MGWRRDSVAASGARATDRKHTSSCWRSRRRYRSRRSRNASSASCICSGIAAVGLIDGDNLRIDYRWGLGDPENIRKYAVELVGLAPDVIFIDGTATVAPVVEATRTVPIVFVNVADPVGAGFVESLARPGGNVTGFQAFEYGISGKWLELLKQIAPTVTRAAILRDPRITSGVGQFAVINPCAIIRCGCDLGRHTRIQRNRAFHYELCAYVEWRPDLTASALAALHHNLIITLAARYRLPAVYTQRRYVTDGGLISYGPDIVDQYRRAAVYVDRILKGEKPSELPVQAPNKYVMVINLKTAKTLGLTIPQALLATANEVIE